MPLKMRKTYMTQAIIHSHEITIEILNLNVSYEVQICGSYKKSYKQGNSRYT
jgi:hypothetical protein